MGCISIDAKVLLYNFFGSQSFNLNKESVPLEIIDKCAIFLANNLPGYVFYDSNVSSIIRVTKKNPEFILSEGKVICKGNNINLEIINNIYSKTISNKIQEIVNDFFENNLFEKEIILLSPIYA